MTPPNVDSFVHAGDVVAGKYRVERVLGVGGMGVVVAARHIVLGERVALKFVLPEVRRSSEVVDRFLREARAATKIRSEHVTRVTDVGQLEDGSPFMVMEYLDGIDLGTWLTRSGPLAPEETVDFILQACEAIVEAHCRGIVHRDLKPENLFCANRPDGTVCLKVLDFGISKDLRADSADIRLTQTTAMMGSPVYMSPEQMKRAASVDLRSDIWSLGVILFELMTGRIPFEADGVAELAIKVALDPPPHLRDLLPRAPEQLDRAVQRCLEKDRDRRFQSVAELAVALSDVASPRGRQSVEVVLATQQRAAATGTLDGDDDPDAGPNALEPGRPHAQTGLAWAPTAGDYRSRRRVLAGVLGALGGLGLAALGVVVLSPSSSRGPAVTTNPAAASSPAPAPSTSEARSSTAAPVDAATPLPVASAPPRPSATPSAPRRTPQRGGNPRKNDDDRLGL